MHYPLPGMPSPQLPDYRLLTQRGLARPPWLKCSPLHVADSLLQGQDAQALKHCLRMYPKALSQKVSCWLFMCLLSVFPAVSQLQGSWDFVSLGLY